MHSKRKIYQIRLKERCLSHLNEPTWLFPYEYMDIGDSFFIPTLNTAEMVYAVECGAKRAKIQIKTFITSKDNHLGVRVWRVA